MKKIIISLLSLLLTNLIIENLRAQNVGIGTTMPLVKLEVKDTIKTGIKIKSKNFQDTTQLIFSNRTDAEEGTDFTISSNQETGLRISSGSDLSANRHDSIMMLTPNARVGINQTNPSEKLDVRGNINLTGALKVNGSNGNSGQVLTSNGAAAPTWQATTIPQIGFTATGTAPAISNHQNIPNGIDTKVTIFNVEEIDNGGLYNPAIARATVPSNGLYHIDVGLNYDNADAGSYSFTFHRISASGTDLGAQRLTSNSIAGGASNQDLQLAISADIYLFANQSIEVFTFQNSGAVQRITGSFFSWFNMHKVY